MLFYIRFTGLIFLWARHTKLSCDPQFCNPFQQPLFFAFLQSFYLQIRQPFPLIGTPYDRDAVISANDLEQYRTIKQGTELSPDDVAFMETPKFKQISKLEAKALESKEDYEGVINDTNWLKDWIPTDDKEFRAAHMAFKTTQKTEGHLSALGNAISNDLLTYMGQFAGSIPYMTILTAGGPITQSGIFYTLAKGQSREAIEEWAMTKSYRDNQRILIQKAI